MPIKSYDNLEIDRTRLRALLAHETAIYFDAKFWTSSQEFQRIAETESWYPKFQDKLESLSLALDNPLISFLLSTYRAYQVESQIMQELGEAPSPPKGLEFWFTQNPCSNHCLIEFLQRNASQLHNLILPLIANSPSYRSRLFMYIKNHPQLFGEKLGRIKSWVVDTPQEFYDQNLNLNLHEVLERFSLSLPLNSPNSDHMSLYNFISKVVIPWHFEELKIFLKQSETKDFSSYILTPLISGYNSRLNSGPRPKIVVGGF